MVTRDKTSIGEATRKLASGFGEARRSHGRASPPKIHVAERGALGPLRRQPRSDDTRPVGTGALTIGEAAARSGVSAKMIRYYESIGLLRPPLRTAANYRTYDEEAMRRLHFIGRARELGFSIREIERLIGLWLDPSHRSAEVKALALRHVEELGERIAVMQKLKSALEHLAGRCHGDERPDCPILDDLAGSPPRSRRG
jgi:Cu(I)-responsive transcriptional regulator